MKASYFLGNKTFEVRDIEIPTPKANEVVVKNMVAGICGTDVHIYHGEAGSADVTPPIVLGHEYSGEVVAVGDAVGTLALGDHVTIDPNIYCGECEYCRNDQKQLCTGMQAIGVTMDGGFAQYSVVPAAQAFKLDPSVPYDVASMAEPIACCIHGIDLINMKIGSSVCVVGGGAIGLIMVQLAKLAGASKIVISEPNKKRRETALSLGAVAGIDPTASDYFENFTENLPTGADVVIECAGNNFAVKNAFEYAKKGATVMLFSVPKVDATFPISLFDLFKKELTIKGSFVNPNTHKRAVDLLNSGKLDFSSIITHQYGVDQLEEAILMQMNEESIKVVVCPQQ